MYLFLDIWTAVCDVAAHFLTYISHVFLTQLSKFTRFCWHSGAAIVVLTYDGLCKTTAMILLLQSFYCQECLQESHTTVTCNKVQIIKNLVVKD